MAQKKRRKFTKERPPDTDPVNDHWRLFLAVQLPESVRAVIGTINQQLGDAQLPLRLVEPHLAHITLHFLGETPPERAELLKLALPASLSSIQAFQLSISTLGVFPNERKPRVVWLGLDGDIDVLGKVHATLARLLRAYDFEIDTRAFHPHITLARTREQAPPSLAPDLVRTISSEAIRSALVNEHQAFDVTEVQLIRSHLGKSGSRYEAVGIFRLGSDR